MNQKENTSDRLKKAINLRNKSQTDLVKETGISKGAISSYINGTYEPKQDNLYKLSVALNVSPSWLMGFDVPMEKHVNNNDVFNIPNILKIKPSTKKIPLLGTIAAGTPILADENIEDYIDLDKEIQADFALRIKGDSMINANIKDGDIVFIHKQSDVDDGDIAAVLIEDSATLKRVFKIGGIIQLRAENSKYPPITLNGDKSVYILGKATYKLSEVL